MKTPLLTNKYGRPAESLVRALIHEERLVVESGSRAAKNRSSVMGCGFFMAVILISLVSVLLCLVLLVMPALENHTSIVLFVLTLLFFGGGLATSYAVWRKVTKGHESMERQIAEDKVDSLLTMAGHQNWKIDRVLLPNKQVEYRLIIPGDDRSHFSGAPAIVMGPRSAEKADLLILLIKEDQRLVEKWSNRTGTG